MTGLRVLRVHHAAGEPGSLGRERALAAAGVELTLVAPEGWPGVAPVDVPHRRLPVHRPGDVNRHRYADPDTLRQLVDDVRPDVIDLHEEPVSVAARQWLQAAGDVPVVLFTAQNVDKRWPPPFHRYERAALSRASAAYPCSTQAASVLRGKGFGGQVRVLPLGVDTSVHRPGTQDLPAGEVVLGLVGRLVPEKGVDDAVRVLAAVNAVTPAQLVVVGEGPAGEAARRLAASLGVADRCTWQPWSHEAVLAEQYRRMHVVLVPSRATPRWVEQFGRVVTEARAGGAVPVAYASGALPEVVGDAGVVVSAGDVDALARATTDLLTSPDRWRARRRVALAAVASTSWQAVAAAQLELYERALATPPQPARRPSAATRAAARAEFGPSATTPSGRRPFALPVLRQPGPVPRLLGAALDRLGG